METDGTKMKLNGYRAYFHAHGDAGSTISTVFDGVTSVSHFATTNEGIGNVYNVAGQLVRRNATSLQGLPQGIYLVGGKAVVVK